MRTKNGLLVFLLSALLAVTAAAQQPGGGGAPTGTIQLTGNLPPASDTVGSSTPLGSLNAFASIAVNGQSGVSMQLSAGTLIGTIIPQASFDGGATWSNTWFQDPSGVTQFPSLTFAANNTLTQLSLPVPGGASHVRVKVNVFTSGTANVTLRATTAAINLPIIAQGTATSGQLGFLNFGAVTTSAPTYTAGLSYPPSLKTNGSMRVDATDGALLGGTVGSAPPGAGNNVMAGLLDSSGNLGNFTLSGAQGTGVKVTPDIIAVTSTAASGTVTTGGTFQSIIAASGTRKSCFVQNPPSATEVLDVFFGANGSALMTNSLVLPPGYSLSCSVGNIVLQDNISVTAPTTGHAFVAFSQ